MKFTIHKSEFMKVLTPAMGTVSNKNTITSIEGVLIETLDDGTIQISTYDMNKGVRAVCQATDIERNGKYIINAQRLYQTLRVLPDDDITIDINEKLNCEISCGKSNFSIFAARGEDFPNLPDLVSERGFEVSSSILKKIIGKVTHSIAVQDNRAMLMGAYFKINNEGMEVVSCDSFTLSKCNMACEVNSLYNSNASVDYSFIIPGHALSELTKILPDDDEFKCTVYLSRKHAIIKCDEIIFFTRTIDSDYIDYNRIIPKENDIFITVNRERILSALERANIIAEEKIQGSGKSYVKISVEEDSIILSSSSVNGKVFDEMDCIHEGGNIEIGFNCRYLINSIKAAEGEEIIVSLKTPTQAITIQPKTEDEKFNYLYMVLPVRMNEK
ncbi:MAG: DNA polymerase III subunit beta [Ruminococcaceae bacterium]|nr:DNA polymerase III subunit beta [Oscillospiraceae bacterium]